MTQTQVWVNRGYCVYAALVLLVIINVALSGDFLTLDNAYTQLVTMAPVVIGALGVALVVGTGGIDLSVPAVMALSTALLPLSPVVSLLVGAFVGLMSGTLVAVFGVQPIVATLAI